MGLDVAVPDPPELAEGRDLQEYDDVEVEGDTDYRRGELEEIEELKDELMSELKKDLANGEDVCNALTDD